MIENIPQAPAQISCFGKEKMTPEVAKKVAKKVRGNHVGAYRCVHCGGWHIGSLTFKRPARK